MAQAGRTEHGGSASEPGLIIVAGPTASGKSALAMALAARHDGVIINADAMQCYAELRILTARPGGEDEAQVPHRLYGVLPASTPGNAAWWREAALAVLEEVRQTGKTPILCGGTGMYLQALLHGIAEIPDPGPDARLEARNFLAEAGLPPCMRNFSKPTRKREQNCALPTASGWPALMRSGSAPAMGWRSGRRGRCKNSPAGGRE